MPVRPVLADPGRARRRRPVLAGRAASLPGPAPVAGRGVLALNVPGDPVRNAIREIPIAIQDRSFNADGSLFYPANRAFFEGFGDDPGLSTADIAAGLNTTPVHVRHLADLESRGLLQHHGRQRHHLAEA